MENPIENREPGGAVRGAEAGERLNDYARSIMGSSMGSGLSENRSAEIADFFRVVDFGKFRVAVNKVLAERSDEAAAAVEHVLYDPVITANIVGVLAPAVNALLKVMKAVFDNIEMPPEIMTSAIINITKAIDMDLLSNDLNELAKLIVDIHNGSYILGGTEPRSRAVLDELLRDLFEKLDFDALFMAFAAMGDGVEIAIGVLVDIIARDPRLINFFCKTGVGIINTVLRTLSTSLVSAYAWPDEIFAEIGKEGRRLNTDEAARVLEAFVAFAQRSREANPGMHEEAYRRALESIDVALLERYASAIFSDFFSAVSANQQVRKSFEPEEVGKKINSLLRGFNRTVSPGKASDYARRLFSTVETDELDKALSSMGDCLVAALFSTAHTARSLLKSAGSTGWKIAKRVPSIFFRKRD